MAEEIKTILTADSSPMRREYEKAAAVVKGYTERVEQSRAKVRRSLRDEIAALTAERQGNEELARKLRERNQLREDSIRLARRAGLTEKEAMATLQRKASLERDIAAQQKQAAIRAEVQERARRDYLAQSENAMRRNAVAAAGMTGSLGKTGRGARNSSMAMLELSRAVEDAQYGMRGVVNNIPGLLGYLGVGAGLAGVASMASVAVMTLGSRLQDLQKRAIALRDQRMMRSIFGDLGGGAETWEIENALRQLEAFRQVQRGRVDTAERALDRGAEIEELRRAVELEDRRAALHRRGASELEKLTRLQGSLDDEAEAELERTKEKIRLDLMRERQVLRLLDAERQVVAAEEALEDKRRSAQAFAARAMREKMAELDAQGKTYPSSEARENAREQWIKHFYQYRFKEQDREALAAARAAAEISRKKIEQLDEELRRLRQQTTIRQEALAVDEARLEATRKRLEMEKESARLSWEDGIIESGGRLAEDMAREMERMRALREKATAVEDRRGRSRAGFAAELAALRLEADGRQEMADALRREVGFRDEAVRLAQELGIEERRALELLRQRYQLEQRAEDAEAGAAFGGRGRGGPRGPSLAGGGVVGSIGLRGQVLGFRESEAQRRSRERALRPRNPSKDTSEELLGRQLAVQENLLKVWSTIQKK